MYSKLFAGELSQKTAQALIAIFPEVEQPLVAELLQDYASRQYSVEVLVSIPKEIFEQTLSGTSLRLKYIRGVGYFLYKGKELLTRFSDPTQRPQLPDNISPAQFALLLEGLQEKKDQPNGQVEQKGRQPDSMDEMPNIIRKDIVTRFSDETLQEICFALPQKDSSLLRFMLSQLSIMSSIFGLKPERAWELYSAVIKVYPYLRRDPEAIMSALFLVIEALSKVKGTLCPHSAKPITWARYVMDCIEFPAKYTLSDLFIDLDSKLDQAKDQRT